MTFEDWRKLYPLAALALDDVLAGAPWPEADSSASGKSEAWAQSKARLSIAKQGGMSWRNNVGATPAKCEHCGNRSVPVRYGLANDSTALNRVIKSSDLILAIPRTITPEMVGKRFAQFGAVETKRPDWQYKDTRHEQAQAAWLALIGQMGGFAAFSTGEVEL